MYANIFTIHGSDGILMLKGFKPTRTCGRFVSFLHVATHRVTGFENGQVHFWWNHLSSDQNLGHLLYTGDIKIKKYPAI